MKIRTDLEWLIIEDQLKHNRKMTCPLILWAHSRRDKLNDDAACDQTDCMRFVIYAWKICI